MNLSPKEQDLAQRLGVSTEALDMIKSTLHPDMGTITRGGVGEPEESFIPYRYVEDPYLPEDMALLKKIGEQYPQLKPMSDMAVVRFAKGPRYWDPLMTEDENRRNEKVMTAMRKYQALMSQESDDAVAAATGKVEFKVEAMAYGIEFKPDGTMQVHGTPPPKNDFVKSDEAADKYIEGLDKKYAGKELRPENRGKEFLALKFFSNDNSKPPADPRIPALRDKLAKLGYRIIERESSERTVRFKTHEELEKFLHAHEIAENHAGVEEQNPRQMQVIYPVDWQKDLANPEDAKTIVKQNPFSGNTDPARIEETIATLKQRVNASADAREHGQFFEILPGTTVKPTSDRKWLLTIPQRYSASLSVHTAVVAKIEGPGYELLTMANTRGYSPDLTRGQIIEQLKKWDQEYGISILHAEFSSVSVQFKKLPTDLDPLLKQMIEFCPGVARDGLLADPLRKSKTVHFTWP